jgi:hypothetical protein
VGGGNSLEQLRRFHAVYAVLPWSAAEPFLLGQRQERPAAPEYSKFIDQT